jgi:hypothetical protein
VLDTGATDHDAHSGLVADEIDHTSGDLARVEHWRQPKVRPFAFGGRSWLSAA